MVIVPMLIVSHSVHGCSLYVQKNDLNANPFIGSQSQKRDVELMLT